MNVPDKTFRPGAEGGLGPTGHVGVKNKEQGFSLIEVLVSLTIVGISMVVLLQIFSGGLHRMVRSDETFRASVFARSLEARIGRDLPLQTGLLRGENDQGFKWDIDIFPYDTDQGLIRVNVPRGQLYQLTIRVTWPSSVRQGELVLQSLRYEGGARQ